MRDNVPSEDIYNGKMIYFDKDDVSKFFIKKFPELLMSSLTITLWLIKLSMIGFAPAMNVELFILLTQLIIKF